MKYTEVAELYSMLSEENKQEVLNLIDELLKNQQN